VINEGLHVILAYLFVHVNFSTNILVNQSLAFF